MTNKKLVLLVNLGSPEELSVTGIRRFLWRFLSDKRVVGLPRLVWYPILAGIILPFRAKKLLHKYRQIWKTSSPPLIYYTDKQAYLLQAKLIDEYTVDYAFCYGTKTLQQVLSGLDKINSLIVIPLYPQYSSATTASVFDQIAKFYARAYFIPELKFINSFATNELYIQAITNQIKKFWQGNGRGELLIISFHSLPVKLIELGDKYMEECQESYRLIGARLGLRIDIDVRLGFQSKFGRARWIEPGTDSMLINLAKSGVREIDVICPGFVSDCLETLEEVALTYKELFIKNGGNSLNYIPCLNDNEDLINLLEELVIA